MSKTIYLENGATEADIRSALYSVSSEGGTIVLPKDASIDIGRMLFLSMGQHDVTIDLNGSTLNHVGTGSVLAVVGKEAPLTSVSLGLSADNQTTVSFDKLPSDIKVGSWINVVADDPLPGDHIDFGDDGQPTRLGQAAKVVSIEGNTVVVEGQLVEQSLYQTNVRANVYPEGQFTLKNGTIDGQAVDYITDGSGARLVHLRTLVEPVIENLHVQDAQRGVVVVDSVNTQITDIVGKNLGAVVQSATSYGTSIDGLFGEHVGHGVAVHGTGTNYNHWSGSSYGADIGLHAQNAVVFDARLAAFDFHSESRNGIYSDSLAFDSRMFGDLRGMGNSFIDSGGANNQFAIQLFEYGDGDGRDSLVENMVMRETGKYSFIISGLPQDNLIKDSHFESYGKGYGVRSDIAVLENTTVVTYVKGDDDTLNGTAADDKLLGGRGVDIIDAGPGNDYIWGGAEQDWLSGGAGHDRFAYYALSEGWDVITDFQAGAKGDVIDVSVLAARLDWYSDNALESGHVRAVQLEGDTLVQAKGEDGWVTLAVLKDVLAKNFVSANLQTRLSDVEAWNSTDTATNTVKLPFLHERFGSDGNDWFTANGVADLFIGSSGDDGYVFDDVNDTVANETVDGGKDTIWARVTVDLRKYANIENLRLHDEGGRIDGTGNADGNLITGNKFDNVIRGGEGNDRLYGRGGADSFAFSEFGSANRDSIWDFDDDDRILLDKTVFKGLDLDGDGRLDADAFIFVNFMGVPKGDGAQIAYNRANGMLSYDADGSGQAQDIVLIGSNRASVDFQDIWIV